MGFAVIVLETGMIVGADEMGGVHDGTCEWNEGTKLLELELKVLVPEGVPAV